LLQNYHTLGSGKVRVDNSHAVIVPRNSP